MSTHRQFVDPDAAELAPTFGGPGGNAFDDAVVGGDAVRAIWLASGSVVDAVQLVYRNRHRTSRHGGTGGVALAVELGPNELVLGLSGRAARLVEYLAVRTTDRVIAAGNPHSMAPAFVLDAPMGLHVTGLHGRCGHYLDAVGARFAPLPAPRLLPREQARESLRQMGAVHFGRDDATDDRP